MAGEQAGRMLGEYVFGTPTTTLQFDYTDKELEEIRSGILPDTVAAQLSKRSKTVTSRATKVQIAFFAVFALLSAVIAANAENGRVAVPILLMSCWAVFAAGVYWRVRAFRHPLKTRAVKVQLLRAYKSRSEFSVRFGQTAMTGKSWSMDRTAYQMVAGDALHNVYSVADILVYLEEVEEPALV